MYYIVPFFIGLVVGAACLFLYIMEWHKKVKEREQSAASQSKMAAEAQESTRQTEDRLVHLEGDLKRQQADLQKRIISYKELQDENVILKRDLQNIDVNVHKLELDGEILARRQQSLDDRANNLAERYLSETVKSVVSSIGPNNFAAFKQRLHDVIGWCREIGFDVPAQAEAQYISDLKKEFERAVRAAFEREEQARIKAQIREEERLRKEIDRELRQLERERLAIQAALDQALAEARGQFSAEVEALKTRLAEAEEKSKRTISMAEQTKAGHVYVISNIGTFGDGVFKIGMTRRLNPQERVQELGSASVPFPFDVHMMISCDNAPSLENSLHRALHKRRVNRANPRKEFFKADIGEICDDE